MGYGLDVLQVSVEGVDKTGVNVILDVLGVCRYIRSNGKHGKTTDQLEAEIAHLLQYLGSFFRNQSGLQLLKDRVQVGVLKGSNCPLGVEIGLDAVKAEISRSRAGEQHSVELTGPATGPDFREVPLLQLGLHPYGFEIQGHRLADVDYFGEAGNRVQGDAELQPVGITGFGQ